MNPIPHEALPIVHRLRLEVERPGELPRYVRGTLEFQHPKYLQWTGCCPLGMLPGARGPFPGGDSDAEFQFHVWWDRQREPQAATDAIWPADGRWCRKCGSRPVDPAMGTAITLLTCPECEREFCIECIDAEGDRDWDGLEPIVYPCRECGEGEA